MENVIIIIIISVDLVPDLTPDLKVENINMEKNTVIMRRVTHAVITVVLDLGHIHVLNAAAT